VIAPGTVYPRLPLSRQERRILARLALGSSVQMIATELEISPETTKSYIKRVRTKYDNAGRSAPTAVLLTHRAIEDGVLLVVEEDGARGLVASDFADIDAPDRWIDINGMGGVICTVCGMPVESEPCAEHQPAAYARCVA